MTTTTHFIGHRRGNAGHGYAQAIDHAVAQLGITLLRWANHRRRQRALSHEAHSRHRQLELGREARELDAQRLPAMRGY